MTAAHSANLERSQARKGGKIKLATYNIRDGRNVRLEGALRAMKQMNVDLGILTETKFTDGVHTRFSSGYNVVATRARLRNQGGVALFFKNLEHWHVESVQQFEI